MKSIKIIFTIQFLILQLMNAQTGEFYSIESAIKNPKDVRTLFLNFTVTEIKELPREIGELENLEELIFFPRLFKFPKFEGEKVIKNSIDDSELRSIDILPNEISKCKNLRIMDFTFSSLKELPKNLNQFPNLEMIRLTDSPLNLNNEMENLLLIENQLTLEIFKCEISENNLEKLRGKENLRILAKEEDYGDVTENKSKEHVNLIMGSTFISFGNMDEANRFINSMPKKLQEMARSGLKEN